MNRSEKIGILNLGISNIESVINLLKNDQYKILMISSSEDFNKCDKIIFPGVGTFAEGMKRLKKLRLLDTLYSEIVVKRKNYLGICLGYQILLSTGNEGQSLNEGLNVIEGFVEKIDAKSKNIRLPHMGWNNIIIKKNSKILNGVEDNENFYFIHSYYAQLKEKKYIVATTEYGIEFPSIIEKENIFGVQFHPEKSLKNGKLILKNFLEINA